MKFSFIFLNIFKTKQKKNFNSDFNVTGPKSDPTKKIAI